MTDAASPPGGQAAAMDRMYRYTRHVYDLTRKPYLLGRDRMIGRLDVPAGGSVLELGCGTGRNLIAVARRYPDCRLYGLDISAEMLRTARANVERAGLSSRITLGRGDATAVDAEALFGRTDFDRVYFFYALSMIPDWRGALREGARLLGPDGRLAVVDFGDGRDLGLFRSALWRWLDLFHVHPRVDMEAAMQAVALELDRPFHFEHPHRRYAQIGLVG